MPGTSFRRARGFGHTRGPWWGIDLVAVVAASIVPVLVVILGLAIQLLVTRSGIDVPRDWVLAPIMRQKVVPWPFLGSPERCLFVLVVGGGLMAGVESLCVALFYRNIHAWALRTANLIKSEIRAQAFRIGPIDLLGDRRSLPEELFSDRTETLRQGLVRWRVATPRSWVAVGVLLVLALASGFWLTILAVVLVFVIWRFYGKRRMQLLNEAHGWLEEARQRHDELLETFRLSPLISGFGLSETPGERFDSGMAQYESAALKAHTTESFHRPLLLLTVLFAAALFLLVIGLRQDTSVAGSAVLVTSLLCAYYPALGLYRLNASLQSAEQAASEIFTYLDRQPAVGQVADAKPLERLQHEIRIEDVVLSDRGGAKLLDDVTFAIAAGQRVAILASDTMTPTGLAGLFVRFYDPAGGRILFDGRDIRRATLDTIRGQAIFVAKDGPIFTGTVADNIGCGDAGFTSLQISDAARRTGIHDFIQQLPQGIATIVGKRDVPIGPEHAFCIGLTRALLRQPSLLIVEEPTHPLSDVMAALVDTALTAAASGRTLIVLASRLTTLRSADHVYVFHQGALFSHGRHNELLQSSDLYRHLNYIRFNPFREKPRASG